MWRFRWKSPAGWPPCARRGWRSAWRWWAWRTAPAITGAVVRRAKAAGGHCPRAGAASACAAGRRADLGAGPATTRGILDCLADINQRLGVTVVIVTHEMAVVRAILPPRGGGDAGTIAEIFPVIDGVAQANSAAGLALLEEA